jgi:hypothetical protein
VYFISGDYWPFYRQTLQHRLHHRSYIGFIRDILLVKD